MGDTTPVKAAPVDDQKTQQEPETVVQTTTTEETVIQAEHVKTTTEKTKVTETTVTTTTEDPKEPEVIQAERVEDEPEVVEEEQQKSSVPQSNLEEVDDGEGEDIIQAVRCETPKFFPPKEESDTQSVQSRKSSS